MAKFTFNMPDVGEGVAEAEVVEWHVRVGDRVEEDQHLVDVMTDKATIDIESPVSGTVVAVAGEVGDVIAIGAMLLVIEVEGEDEVAAEAEAAPEKPLPPGEGAFRAQPQPQRQPRPRPQPRSPAASRQSRSHRRPRPPLRPPFRSPGFRYQSSPCRSSHRRGADPPRPGHRHARAIRRPPPRPRLRPRRAC